jgi:hypothetical protein
VMPIALFFSMNSVTLNRMNYCKSFRNYFSASAADTHSSNFLREIS